MSLARLEPIVGPEKIAGNPKGEDAGPVEETATVGETAGGEPTEDSSK